MIALLLPAAVLGHFLSSCLSLNSRSLRASVSQAELHSTPVRRHTAPALFFKPSEVSAQRLVTLSPCFRCWTASSPQPLRSRPMLHRLAIAATA